MRRATRWTVVIPGLVSLGLGAAVRADDPDGVAFFEREIRPILAEHCLKCHGPEMAKSDLRLDSREAILTGGASGPAAAPGSVEESLLLEAISYRDEPRMPPNGKLGDAEIEALSKWVAMGLPWPEGQAAAATTTTTTSEPFSVSDEQRSFWSFRPVTDPEAPSVRDASWPRGELDRFVLAGLEAASLKPASEADKRTLIRRATVDLTGLPPTPDEVGAYLRDESPEAFDRVVDRLLDSPAYGERWARHWLDVVRYADSLDARGSGQPGDILDAWRYRDWVVNAMNTDMTYDEFVKMQVAGDVIGAGRSPEAFDRSGTIATTMLAIGNWGNGDADKEKILTDIADDQVDVVSKAFLGLTVACARCHDHKFDPIGQEDYYGLAGIFFSTHILPKLTPKGAGETIARVPLVSEAELARRDAYAKQVAELEQRVEAARAAKGDALAASLRPQAARYVVAAWERLNGSTSEREGLHPFALRRWADALGGPGATPLTQKIERVGGNAGVDGWGGQGPSASTTANATDQTLKVLTFTLPARSVSVHPGPESAAVISWRSPVGGIVRISGTVADGDAACGDGFGWSVELRGVIGAVVLASGEVANSGSSGLVGAALDAVEVRPGERIELVIHRRGEYACDTTTVEMAIATSDGAEDWSLTRDCVDALATANPVADRTGRAGVWTFGDGKRPGPGSESAESVAARAAWRQALESGAGGAELEAAAAALGAALTTDPARSPFRIETVEDEAALPEADRVELTALRAELASLRAATPPPIEFANAAREGGVPESPHAGCHDVAVHLRGRYDRLGPVVARRFPIILAGDAATQPRITEGSGRKELAEWLASPSNPLTARVMVNRIWQHHFGAGLVRTPSNFGKLGEPPTHPELLDWLASRFVEDGWSMKAIHRRIMMSATYRQSSVAGEEALARDPDNRLLGRMNRRRLESEVLRDQLLAAAGALDPMLGGPEVRDAKSMRRGLYMVTIRSDRATYGSLFDQADPTAPVERRVESTVAPQALYLLNNGFVADRAREMASRLIREAPDDSARIARAYTLLFAREPTSEELEVGLQALAAFREAGDSDEVAWAAYAHVLFCTNEFIYVD